MRRSPEAVSTFDTSRVSATCRSISSSGTDASSCQRWDCWRETDSGRHVSSCDMRRLERVAVSASNTPSFLSARSFSSAARF